MSKFVIYYYVCPFVLVYWKKLLMINSIKSFRSINKADYNSGTFVFLLNHLEHFLWQTLWFSWKNFFFPNNIAYPEKLCIRFHFVSSCSPALWVNAKVLLVNANIKHMDAKVLRVNIKCLRKNTNHFVNAKFFKGKATILWVSAQAFIWF